MKKLKYIILWYLLLLNTKSFADDDAWVLWWTTVEKLKTWNIHTDDIPWIVSYAIDFFMGIAWTIAVIFIIIWAYNIAFWSLSWDKSKWKETIFLALAWFVLASLSWVILKLIIDNFA